MTQKIPPPVPPRKNISAVILAGGEGRRAGNRDKGTITWQGLPLIAHVRNRLEPQVGRILISCNRNTGFYADYADQTFPDLRADYQGPMAGLEAAANHVATDYVLVAPCDTPLLPEDLAQRLLAALETGELDACYARSGSRNHYLCALLRRNCLETVSHYLDSGRRAVRHWFAEHETAAVDFDPDCEAFRNINEPL